MQHVDDVMAYFNQAAYLMCYSGFDAEEPSVEWPLVPFLPELGFQRTLFQVGRRLRLEATVPTVEAGFRVRMRVENRVTTKNYLILKIIKNNFQPNFFPRDQNDPPYEHAQSNLNPAPTVLLPFLSQKSMLIDEQFELLDERNSRLHLDGVSRTFPAKGGLFIAGIGDITESHGHVEDSIGHIGVAGWSELPPNFSLNLVFRIVNPPADMVTTTPIGPIEEEYPEPYPYSIQIALFGELDPNRPVEVRTNADGQTEVRTVEILRLTDPDHDIASGMIKTHHLPGPVVGERHATFVFDPDHDLDIIPAYTKDSEFRFYADGDKLIGSVRAELAEARAMRTNVPELEAPYFRVGGYGGFSDGRGQFKGIQGIVSATGAFSLSPHAVSTLYILRFNDRNRRFRRVGGP